MARRKKPCHGRKLKAERKTRIQPVAITESLRRDMQVVGEFHDVNWSDIARRAWQAFCDEMLGRNKDA